MQPPDLSIVIVNYNGGEDLRRTLTALVARQEELAFEVFVVDNGSSDGSIDRAEAEFGRFQYLRAGRNLGFAAGCNLGLEKAQGRHVMLLNPDTEVLPGSLPRMVAALDTHPNWGMVGPRMVDQTDQPYNAARRFPTPFYLFCEVTRLVYLFPHSKLFGAYFYGTCPLEDLDRVDQVEGSALMISGAVRHKVGDLDDRFFLFFEEVDWCKRVTDAGFEVHVLQDAIVRHHRATTMTRFFKQSRTANAQSAMRYFLKHYGPAGLKSLRRWMRAGLWLREMMMRAGSVMGHGEKAGQRAEAAHVERSVYRRGLEG
jgi:N-acetylglucosaminyl-diphospho-decaprenol L-rhamnosyltransferase